MRVARGCHRECVSCGRRRREPGQGVRLDLVGLGGVGGRDNCWW
jgi:hypothetical protein